MVRYHLDFKTVLLNLHEVLVEISNKAHTLNYITLIEDEWLVITMHQVDPALVTPDLGDSAVLVVNEDQEIHLKIKSSHEVLTKEIRPEDFHDWQLWFRQYLRLIQSRNLKLVNVRMFVELGKLWIKFEFKC